MDDFIKEPQGNHRSRNILIAVSLAAGTLLTGILIRRRRKRPISGTSPPVKKKLLEKIKGLSEDEVQARQQPDLDNSLSFKPVRSRREIWRENILSIFNLSLVGLALVQLLFARPLDALLSLGVLGLNVGINVFQENFARMRLKDILQETRPMVTVIRDQTTRSIDANELVIGDMVAFGPGDELLADGIVVHQDELVVDESMIGDRDRRAVKGQGDVVFAGAFCVSGHAVYQVEKIGSDRYITKLIENSKETKEQLTPIEVIIGNVLRVLLFIVAIFTVGLIYTYLNLTLPIPVDVFNEVAGIIFSIAPAGLFFMIIVTYAASTVDLARFGALVHQARSVEAMAQVNTICFSREGVLTGTKLDLNVLAQGGAEESIPQSRIQQILGDYVRSSAVDNKITRTIRNNFPGSARKTLDEAPYLSIYGWSAINFDDPDLSGTYILGVPAALEPYLNQQEPSDEQPEDGEPNRARKLASRLGSIFRRSKDDQGDENKPADWKDPAETSDNPVSDDNEKPDASSTLEEDSASEKPGLFRRFLKRVSQLSQPDALEEELPQEDGSDPPIELIFAYYPDPGPLFDEQGRPQFPVPLSPLCELSFTEQVRPESVSVIKSFHNDGIGVKIFAGERPNQIIELLKKAGLSKKSLNTISGADLSQLEKDGFSQAAEDNGIFLNLAPEQMGEIVAALRANGQYVAMVGDAVNDVPALRQADLAASYQGSSPAAQSVADILLLENTLRVLNRVLDKGQRIVNGLLDILKLYLTQVSYLTLMIVGILIIGTGFPVRGIQLTIITTVTITLPALGLTLWANPGVLYGNSLRKSLSHFIIPAAITVAVAGIFTFFLYRGEYLERAYTHLAVTYTLVFTGLLVVLFLRPPFRLLAGGSSVSQDRRIFKMVGVLTVLFFITVALSSAITFLNDLLLLEWLHPLMDYLIIVAIVIVWAVILLLIWRIWRTSGIWEDQEVSKVEEIENEISATADQSDENQVDDNPPQQTT
jgi:magnesium-transporting ATPase (P-type)